MQYEIGLQPPTYRADRSCSTRWDTQLDIASLHTTTASAAQPKGFGAFRAVDEAFDLSSGKRDIFDAISTLTPGEREEFLDTLAGLLHQGVVGIETLDVGGRPYQSFIETRIAAPELKGARPYRGTRFSTYA